MSGRPGRATVLKLITGGERPDRVRDDHPVEAGTPVPPPGVVMTAAEQRLFDWLVRTAYQPGVHGVGDGAAFVQIARLWIRAEQADAEIAANGMTSRNSRGTLVVSPWVGISNEAHRELRIAMTAAGVTVSGRHHLAGRMKAGESTSWDDV